MAFVLHANEAAKIISPKEGWGIDLRTSTPCDHHKVSNQQQPEQHHCVEYAFPCVLVDHENDTNEKSSSSSSSFGQLFTNLFINMHPCPVDDRYYNQSSCPTFAATIPGVHWMTVATTAIEEYQQSLQKQQREQSDRLLPPNMFQLNATFIEHVTKQAEALVTLSDVVSPPSLISNSTIDRDSQASSSSSVCAIQSRFGDYWTRHRGRKKDENDKRVCLHFDKHHEGDKEVCFEEEASRILNQVCPDPSERLYVATDWDEFAEYMCTHFRLGREDDGLAEAKSDQQRSSAKSRSWLEWWRARVGKENSRRRQFEKRQFVSKCPSSKTDGNGTKATSALYNVHSQDLNLKSERGIMALNEMITDWIVLIFSDACKARQSLIANKHKNDHHSTFLSSTCYPWELVW